MENRDSQNLAERIAEILLLKDKKSDEFLRSSLEIFNERLSKIESNLTVENPQSLTCNLQSNHSSQEKFLDLETLANETINSLKDEKACPFEPTGKPCDNCAMCNSLGF